MKSGNVVRERAIQHAGLLDGRSGRPAGCCRRARRGQSAASAALGGVDRRAAGARTPDSWCSRTARRRTGPVVPRPRPPQAPGLDRSLAATAGLLVLNGLAHSIGESIAAVVVIVVLLSTRRGLHRPPRSGQPAHRTGDMPDVVRAGDDRGCRLPPADPDAVERLSAPKLFSEVWLGFLGISGPAQFESAQTRQRLETTLLLLGVVVAVATVLVALRTARAPKHQVTPKANGCARCWPCTATTRWPTSRFATTSP